MRKIFFHKKNVLMFLLIFFRLFMVLDFNHNLVTLQDTQPVVIFTKSVETNCAFFEVYYFGNGNGNGYFEEVISNRDNTSFYYIDEDKQEVIIQKKVSPGQFIVRYIFTFQKKRYEILMKSCSEKLSENKKELHILHKKINNQEILN